MKKIKILAVQDPAVSVYVDSKLDVLKKFPKKDVEVEFDIISWDEYFDTMMKSFQGSADYDIVMIAGHLWLRDFAEKGYLQEINYDFEDILPVIAKEMQYKEKTYLSPSFCDGHMIVYRKSAVKQATGKLPGEIMTADEFLDIAEKLHKAGYQRPVALKAAQSEILLDALPYLRSGGKDLYIQTETGIKCNISELENELEKYVSLKKFAPEGTNAYGNDDIKEMLSDKKIVMATTWSGQLGVVMKDCKEKEDMGFATFDTAWNVTWSFAITSVSKNKEDAQALLEYLRSPEIDALAGECSGAPVRKCNYISGADRYPWYKVQLKMIEEYAKPFPAVPEAGEMNGVLYDAIYSAFTGEKSIKQVLSEAQTKTDSISERS
ncbi:extracellular solute-binding protein [Proteocatella sphenisci]|uniref:extracellular solute-binding protein n=1 Tax=Proteocatella sphenisci TaxID=181070 RepID=UPI0004AE1C23|nr:extracellular solute-binding protein [Proteocatella sphenisci]